MCVCVCVCAKLTLAARVFVAQRLHKKFATRSRDSKFSVWGKGDLS